MSFVNNVKTSLRAALDTSATSIQIEKAASPFNNPPTSGKLTFMDSLSNPSKIEVVSYTGRTDNSTYWTLTGVTRGLEDTNAASFVVGAYVIQTWTAGQAATASDKTISATTGLQSALDGKVDDSQVLTNVPSGALFTDNNTVYTHPTNHAISVITGLQDALDDKVDDSQVLTNVPSGAVFTDTETTTSISHNGSTKTLSYTDETGTTTNIDLTAYVDDTNLARLVSGSLAGATGIATFTRDDSSTFTIDMSDLLDTDTNTWRGIDNTPVNGQTGESISSGWAFDHAASSTAHPRDTRNQIVGDYNNYVLPASVIHQTELSSSTSSTSTTVAANLAGVKAAYDRSWPDTNTTYSVGDGGLTQINFTTADNDKLDGIATFANNYVLPSSVIHQTELSSSVSSTSTTIAANSAAVKTAYDRSWPNTTYTASKGVTLSGTQFRLTGSEIPSGANLNTYRTTGNYPQNSNADATAGTNWPVNAAGILQVINDDYGNGIHCTQLYSQYNTNDYFHRSYYGGSWSSWKNLTQDTNTTYSVGDGGLTQKNFTTADNDKLDGIETGATADQDLSALAPKASPTLTGTVNSPGYFTTPSSAHTFTTPYGNITLGPGNSGWGHIQTDRATFYMNRSVHINGGVYKYNGGAEYWHPDNDGSGSGLDADTVDGIQASSFLQKSGGTMTGIITTPSDIVLTGRDNGLFGLYNSTQTDHIWSMGTAYRNHASGTDFGNLYGLAYKHTNNTTGGNMGGSHQMVWCANGSPRGAIGYDYVWHTNGMRVGSNTVWHAGNDGSGSGLDADTVDGIQGSQLLRSDTADTASGHITLSGGFSGQSTLLSGAQNFDNIKTSGFYSLYSTQAGTNAPPFDYGTMISANNTASGVGMGMQLAHERFGNGMYVRGMNDTNDTWSSWAEVWTSTTDGSGSGLDADLLDGQHASAFVLESNVNNYVGTGWSNVVGKIPRIATDGRIELGRYTDFKTTNSNADYDIRFDCESANVLNVIGGGLEIGGSAVWHAGNDGSGSGLDADLLDGVQGSSYFRSDTGVVNLRATSNGGPCLINFSDNIPAVGQSGTIEYVHTDGSSYGSGNAFKVYGTEASMSFHVAGTGLFTGNVTAYYSDERLKDFEGTIPNALDKVKQLNGYYYKGNDVAATFGYDTEGRQVGVSAQEVEAVLPEIVVDAAIGEGYKTVQYDKLVPLLIEAIKEQQTQIDELKEMIKCQ